MKRIDELMTIHYALTQTLLNPIEKDEPDVLFSEEALDKILEHYSTYPNFSFSNADYFVRNVMRNLSILLGEEMPGKKIRFNKGSVDYLNSLLDKTSIQYRFGMADYGSGADYLSCFWKENNK